MCHGTGHGSRQVGVSWYRGCPRKETATLLGISSKTVESHRHRIMEKLDIHDTAGLVRHAIRRGLIQP
ncbi:MAG TPA: LuxR C-terminal-related transcriptional regulator [Candidatus Methylomirabilis sp.]|nr:LuxR C-terminal-related transcriptional regulator [Candidatus Methylomirabilis sp.]